MEAGICCVFGVVYIALFFLFFFASNTPVEYALSGAFLGLALYMFGRCIGKLCGIVNERRAARRAEKLREKRRETYKAARDITLAASATLCNICPLAVWCKNQDDGCPIQARLIDATTEEIKKTYPEEKV